MDILSVTVSIITVISAIDQSIKCIRKLSDIRKAPEELLALLTEVSSSRGATACYCSLQWAAEPVSQKSSVERVARDLKGQAYTALERHWSELH